MHARACEAVGIDLGTTYSSLAYMDGNFTPRIVPDALGVAAIPSVVCFDEREIIVGEAAREQARVRPEQVAQFIKVQMGENWRRTFQGYEYTPESISAIILRHLVREAVPQIGPIRKAVITVPAYFTEKRRRATQLAGELAGLKVIGTLNEPLAATLAYGLFRQEEEQLAVVYDLGGGTFDVTVVRIAPNAIEEIATRGNRQLGGKDWDQCLIDRFADDFLRKFGQDPRSDPQATQDLLIECERAKRRLSQMNKAAVRLQAFGCEHALEFSRAQFEMLTAPLLQSTKLTTELALEDAELTWDKISRVVLVGGSTHMPAVRTMLQQASGRTPDVDVDPVTAVALGASIYAYILESGQSLTETRQQAAPESTIMPVVVGSDMSSSLFPLRVEEFARSESTRQPPAPLTGDSAVRDVRFVEASPPRAAGTIFDSEAPDEPLDITDIEELAPLPSLRPLPALMPLPRNLAADAPTLDLPVVVPEPPPAPQPPAAAAPAPAGVPEPTDVRSLKAGPAIVSEAVQAGKSPLIKPVPQSDAFAPTLLMPKVRFVTAHGVGIKSNSADGPQNSVLIARNTSVPTEVTRRFFIAKQVTSARQYIKVEILQGDNPRIELAEVLGVGKIEGFTEHQSAGQPVDVTISFDEQGRLHVRAVYVPTGQAMLWSMEIAGGLQEAEVWTQREFLNKSNLFDGVAAREAQRQQTKATNDDESDFG